MNQFSASDIEDLCNECDGKRLANEQQRELDALKAAKCHCTGHQNCSTCQPSLWVLRTESITELEVSYRAGVAHGREERARPQYEARPYDIRPH